MKFLTFRIWPLITRTAVNIGLAIISTAAMAVLAEAVFTHIISTNPEIADKIQNRAPHKNGELKQYHPLLGYDGIPSSTVLFNNSVRVSHNQRGLRGPVVPYARKPGTKRIMMVGDSQTWGWGLRDEETISVRLQEVFDRQTEPKTEVINLGMNGYGTDQEYLKYLIEGAKYSPDIVILTFFVRNDLHEVTADSAWGVPKPRFFLRGEQLCLTNVPVPRVPGWPDERTTEVLNQLIDTSKPISIPIIGLKLDLTRSRIYQYFEQRELQPFYLSGKDSERLNQLFSDPALSLNHYLPCLDSRPAAGELKNTGELGSGLKMFFAILERFRERIEAHRGQILVVLSPDTSDYNRSLPYPRYALVAEELKQRKFESLDILEYGLAQKIPADVLYGAYAHFSNRGAELVAEAIFKKLNSVMPNPVSAAN